ncbi:hypothetical protein PARSHIK_251 [Erwinia phage vB_EamM_Parshik]|uniref:Uncharacterized protein n=1 Tax=Erwinia phage vB_EamM_Huxley TaxID=1883373 RepID=A0A1B2IDL4_9CAUD|nr:hypothetical protein BIZ81_gp033 [Erwinia phage vB_EamM_Huxley]ANZ49332.1 hypothetical protein HUXLEY_250 [Erwinia phage vB_EamM_Huxley]ANZ50160.1 hypothetical protein PARSHIK_251 [Erwinia phage vB_EamM_Parshik]
MDTRSLNDTTWVNGLFGSMKLPRDTRFYNTRTYSDALLSFSDTTVGGNAALNAPPQFTFFADPPITGALAVPKEAPGPQSNRRWFESFSAQGSYRLGAYYYESIEQNAFYLHCRFGKPRYLGVAAFFANMYDSKLAYLARTGDYPGVIRSLASYTAAAAIWATVGTVAFALILITPRIMKAVLDKQSSKYYYVKPTMHLYLRAVQNIVNTQLLYRRLVPTGILSSFGLAKNDEDKNKNFTANKEDIYAGLPDIWKSNGEFDIYRMINRYQTLANFQAKTIEEIKATSKTEAEMATKIQSFYKTMTYSRQYLDKAASFEVSLSTLEQLARTSAGYKGVENPDMSEDQVLDNMTAKFADADSAGGGEQQFLKSADVAQQQLQAQTMANNNGADDNGEALAKDTGKIENWMREGEKSTFGTMFGEFSKITDGIVQQAGDELSNGSQWVTWKINGRDTTTRTFSNSTKEPEISGTVNSATQKARSLEVSLAGGKTGIDGVDGLITGLKSAFAGALDFLHLSGIMSLYNSSVIDFPEVWDSSDTSGDDISFTIPCRCWSGGDLDVFQDLILPVAFWLAAVCPLATGKQSFTHPFYLEAYSRGRYSMRNAMVTNVSLNFGVGGLGWRTDGVPLSCDINVTIRDMSRTMYMPIVTDTGVWDDDNKFSDFMAVLGSATLHQRTSGWAKATQNANVQFQSWKSAFSQGAIMNKFFDLPPARMVANVFTAFTGTARGDL